MRSFIFALLPFLAACADVPDTARVAETEGHAPIETSVPAETATAAPPDTSGCGTPGRGDLGWMEIRGAHYEADQWRWQYPSWAYAQIEGTAIERDYDLAGDSRLFVIQGDFDGDGRLDAAAQLRRRDAPGEAVVVVVHRAGGVYAFENEWPNWTLYPRGPVHPGVDEGAPPTLRGDALLFVKPEAASALRYWNGRTYAYYHQGD